MDEALFQIIVFLILLFITAIFLFNGCTPSKVLLTEPKENIAIENPEIVSDEREQKDNFEEMNEKESIGKYSDEISSSESLGLSNKNESTESYTSFVERFNDYKKEMNSRTPVKKLCMNFNEWDLDLEISGDEREEVKPVKNNIQKEVVETPIAKEIDKKITVKKNNVSKPSNKLKMNFNDWNSDLKID